MGVELSDIFIMLKPEDQWQDAGSKEALIERMNAVLREEVPGQNYMFSQPIELRTNELISGVRSDVAIKIYGEDLERLRRIGDDVVRALRAVPGAADVSADQVAGLPFLRVRVDRHAISRYGVNASDVMDAVSSIAGHPVGEVFEGQRRFAELLATLLTKNEMEWLRDPNLPVELDPSGWINRESDLVKRIAEMRARLPKDLPVPDEESK